MNLRCCRHSDLHLISVLQKLKCKGFADFVLISKPEYSPVYPALDTKKTAFFDELADEPLSNVTGVTFMSIKPRTSVTLILGVWGGHLWNPSYCAITVSDRSREQVLAYIEGQKKKV